MKLTKINRLNKNIIAFAMMSVAAFASCKKDDMGQVSTQQIGNNKGEEQATPVQDQYIVVTKSENGDMSAQGAGNATVEQIQKILQEKNLGKVSVQENNKFSGGVNGVVVNLTKEQAEALKNSKDVALEQDQAITIGKKTSNSPGTVTPTPEPEPTTPTGDITYGTTVTTDTRDPDSEFIPWGVTRMGAKGASGAGKTAWIIDSGIDYNHYELNVDKTRSKSFLSSADGGSWSSPTDEFGHGTAVAGIIGARDNGKGIIGVAPDANLVSLKVVSRSGSVLVSNIIKALDYVYANGQAGDVVNISLQASASTTLDDAVKRVAAKGIFVTIGAGNSAMDCSSKSPQRVNATNVFTVSAMNADNTFWTGSNYGSGVDITAPGTKIMSTELGGTCNWVSGTSFAGPHIAGLLLINGGKANFDGYVRNDPDSRIDGIAHM